MSFDRGNLNADTLSIIGDWNQTLTLAVQSTTTITTAGDATYGYVSITTCQGMIESPREWRDRLGVAQDVQGIALNLPNIAFLPSITGPERNQRLYEGGAIADTTTVIHHHVARVDIFEGHVELLLGELGPDEQG